MFDRFSDTAIKSIVLAQEHAAKLGFAQVDVPHLLLALLGEKGLRMRLRMAGVDCTQVQAQIEDELGKLNNTAVVRIRPPNDATQLAFTKQVDLALERSFKIAQAGGAGRAKQIEALHLFMSLLDDEENIELLDRIGLYKTTLRTDIEADQRLPAPTSTDSSAENIRERIQYETFLHTFNYEIEQLLTFKDDLSEALSMVVNIAGKCVKASRCTVICAINKENDNWRCFEYHDPEVLSCEALGWPKVDSELLSQITQNNAPSIYDRAKSSVQAELQKLGAKSFVGVALRKKNLAVGCLVIQQCNDWRTWTPKEIDFIDRVARAVSQRLSFCG